MNIGQNIKRRRQELGYTLEDVAQKVGLTRQTLSRYETGVIGNIPSDKIEALSVVLDTSPAYIMGWEESVVIDAAQQKPASSSESGLSEDEIQFIEWYRNQASDKDKALLRTMRGF